MTSTEESPEKPSARFRHSLCHNFFHGAPKHRALITTIGVEFQQERIHAEHSRHNQRAAIAILNFGGMHDGVDQQALRIDKNVLARPSMVLQKL